MEGVDKLGQDLVNIIVNPLLALIFAVAFIVFIWGLIEFLYSASLQGSQDGKSAGKRHMFWGVVGMFIMVSAYTIVKVLQNTFPNPPPPGL